jgi:hypothetical protein
MAQILESNLRHYISNDRFRFRVTAKIRFQPHEVGTDWLLAMTFKEQDDLSPDDYIRSSNRTFRAEAVEQSVLFDQLLSRAAVSTEAGDEEIYANLELIPLQAPPPFVRDTAKTNVSVVDD